MYVRLEGKLKVDSVGSKLRFYQKCRQEIQLGVALEGNAPYGCKLRVLPTLNPPSTIRAV